MSAALSGVHEFAIAVDLFAKRLPPTDESERFARAIAPLQITRADAWLETSAGGGNPDVETLRIQLQWLAHYARSKAALPNADTQRSDQKRRISVPPAMTESLDDDKAKVVRRDTAIESDISKAVAPEKTAEAEAPKRKRGRPSIPIELKQQAFDAPESHKLSNRQRAEILLQN